MFSLLSLLSTVTNLDCLSATVLKLGMEHMLSCAGGQPKAECVVDMDSMPVVDAHSNQLGSTHNGHYHRKIFCHLWGDGGCTVCRDRRDPHGFRDFALRIACGLRKHVADRGI